MRSHPHIITSPTTYQVIANISFFVDTSVNMKKLDALSLNMIHILFCVQRQELIPTNNTGASFHV